MRNEAFLRLFAGSGRRKLENGLELCVVPAYEVLQSRREEMDACGEEMPEENAGFDERRFEELRDAGVCETASSGADETCGAV